jgi:hypothetical protein
MYTVVSLLTSAACAVWATASGLAKIAVAATIVVVNFRIRCPPNRFGNWFGLRYAQVGGQNG